MNTTIDIASLSSSTVAINALRTSTAIMGGFIYVAGFIGNFFSLLLFAQKQLRQVSTGLLFILLNIFSTIHLLSLIVEFLDSIFEIQVIPSGIFRCQFILWLQNATRTICSFLATTISIDRFIRSEYPLPSRVWCTPKNVLKLTIIYVIFSILLYAFFFYPLNLFDDEGNCSFNLNKTFYIVTLDVMPPIRFIFICIIPTILMLGCGGRMLCNIRRSHMRITQQTTTTTIATVDIPIPKGNNTTNENQRQQIATDRMLLLMVITNILAYIITQIPFNTYAVYHSFTVIDDDLLYPLVRAFLLMWSSIYFGVGFYLFCIASRQFRKQFLAKMKTICICWCSSERQASSIRNQ